MQPASPWYYFVSMAILILEGWLLSRILPFHRRQNTKELGLRRVVPVDGLRGILAVSVFFHHANQFFAFQAHPTDWLPPSSHFYVQVGVAPVTMFFFITGYVFWLKMIKHASIPLGPFLYGRIGRLGPVYVFACVLCFTLIAFQSHFHRNESLALLIAQGASWLVFFGAGHDMNHIMWSRLWLGPAWTLRSEWLFYLSLPFLGWFARRIQRLPLIVAVAGTIAFLLTTLNLHLTPHSPIHAIVEVFQAYFSFLAYTFIVGMAVAAIQFSPKVKAWAQTNAASVVSLALIGITLFWGKTEYGWQESLLLVVPFACITLGNTWFGLLSSEPVRFLGRISYSFYLLHVVLLGSELLFFKRYINFATLSQPRYWLFALGSCAFTVLVSAITYQFLEFPFLHVGRPAPKPVEDRTLITAA